jgi:hypothetical protein
MALAGAVYARLFVYVLRSALTTDPDFRPPLSDCPSAGSTAALDIQRFDPLIAPMYFGD